VVIPAGGGHGLSAIWGGREGEGRNVPHQREQERPWQCPQRRKGITRRGGLLHIAEKEEEKSIMTIPRKELSAEMIPSFSGEEHRLDESTQKKGPRRAGPLGTRRKKKVEIAETWRKGRSESLRGGDAARPRREARATVPSPHRRGGKGRRYLRRGESPHHLLGQGAKTLLSVSV